MVDPNPTGAIAALASATNAAPTFDALGHVDDKGPSARICASQELRTAQVELYCDHRSDALSAIRRAKRALEDVGTPSAFVDLAALEEATWHARNNDTCAAVDALGKAKQRLDR
jgi:hypothetical protein